MTMDTWVSIGGFVAVGTGLYTVMRSEFGKVNRKLDEYRLEAKADVVGLRSELITGNTSLRTELITANTSLRTELKGDIAGLRTELKEDIAALRTELKADIGDLRTELTADIQRVDDRVYALAAGLKPQIERAEDDRRAG